MSSCVVISLAVLVLNGDLASLISFSSVMVVVMWCTGSDLIMSLGPFRMSAVVVEMSLSAVMTVKRHLNGSVTMSGR